MIKTVDSSNIDILDLGTALLGSGGGGESGFELEAAKQLLKTTSVEVVSVSELKESDRVLPVAYLGGLQKTSKPKPFKEICDSLLKSFEMYYKRKPSHIMAVEIGGGNGIFPIVVACITGLPLVDGDLLGRAFPEFSDDIGECDEYAVRSRFFVQ